MIEGLKPYSKRKASGALWLPEIPASWEMRRNGRLFVERNETNAGELPILEVSLRTGVRVRNFETGARKQVMADREKYKRARQGDIAYNMMRMWQGAVGVVPTDGLVSPAYVVARPLRDVLPAYFEYVFRTDAYKRQVNDYSRGIVADRNRLYWDSFKQIPTPFPPPDEQAAIVKFLGHADQKINRYMRAKRKLIALLNEQKQAIIHRAVTRGLDPHVKLRSSGVQWLGDVPLHWKLKRFKFVARITEGQIDPRHADQKSKILVAPNHIKSGAGVITHVETADQQGADSGKYEVLKGQVIYSKIRPNLRKAAIASADCLCSADMYPISVKDAEIRSEYFLLLLLSDPFTKYAVDCSLRVAMPKVNRDALADCWLWYPPLDEQEEILKYLVITLQRFDNAITAAEDQIKRSTEYRTRIIADVVTGKVDICAAALKLPDFTGGVTEIDEGDDGDAVDDVDFEEDAAA